MKRRLCLMLPVGCLTLIAGSLVLSWLTLKSHENAGGASGSADLSWQTVLGDHRPVRQTLLPAPMAAPILSVMLPQVLSVEDAAETDRGWVVLDSRSGMLHFLDTGKGTTESVGREGGGPGELRDPVAMALQDSLLWVLNDRGLSLELFHTRTGFIGRTRLKGGACLAGLAKGLQVSEDGEVLLLRICPAVLPGPGTAWIERVSPDGQLHPIVSMTLGSAGSRRLHLARQPVFVSTARSLFLGTWDAPCVAELTVDGGYRSVRCLPAYARPETDPVEAEGLEARLRQITRMGLLPVEVPDHLPWYDRFFHTSQGLVVRRIRGAEERDLVLLQPDGGGYVTEQEFPVTTFVGETSVLAARDILQGTRIQIFREPWD